MAVALSSCIYQSLSDSDAINTSNKKLASKDFATGAVMEALSRYVTSFGGLVSLGAVFRALDAS